MKFTFAAIAALLATAVWQPAISVASLPRQAGGQSFVSAAPANEGAANAWAGIDSADSGPYADGTRAINESRWADAAKIFATVAEQHGEHADGALYWKAYAEVKLGQNKPAQQTCEDLRKGYPDSRWKEDCGALEVEVRARMGKRVEIKPGESDDVKLLALNAMMHQDEPRALAEIQSILNGDASEKLKKEAQFILGTHYSNTTYAQIVRISYVEGDVRIERGETKANGEPWEKAVADLPVETGFSLVTGAGRAEIEFEDASTLYLGENSVLTFNDLHATAGIPYSEVALLSGTVSLHVHPYVAGEEFLLHTPTNEFAARYPDKADARVESFTDGVKITPLESWGMRLPGVPKDRIEPGRTWTYKQGQPWAEEDAADSETAAAAHAWDKWVSERVTARDAAIAAVMKESGLPAAIPGMAEMAGQGKFFDCEPYGTCWEPNDVADEGDETASRSADDRPVVRAHAMRPGFGAQLVRSSYESGDGSARAAQVPTVVRPRVLNSDFDFPCMPASLRYRAPRSGTSSGSAGFDSGTAQSQIYAWAVCHSGSWIRHKKHYAWVASCKRHHLDPVRWIKSEHRIAFVPLHPYDVKGQPAINARHTVFEVSGKGAIAVHPVKFEASAPIEYLKDAPKEYRNAPLELLAHVEAPRMEARVLGKAEGNRAEIGKGVGKEIGMTTVPIHFDVKARSFMMPATGMRGEKTTGGFAPISNRSGTLQARGGSFSGGSGFHGGGSGASSGSHGSGGSGASGSSHGGSSGSGGGGGASHSSSSTSSSSAGSSSSGASSSGSAHH